MSFSGGFGVRLGLETRAGALDALGLQPPLAAPLGQSEQAFGVVGHLGPLRCELFLGCGKGIGHELHADDVPSRERQLSGERFELERDEFAAERLPLLRLHGRAARAGNLYALDLVAGTSDLRVTDEERGFLKRSVQLAAARKLENVGSSGPQREQAGRNQGYDPACPNRTSPRAPSRAENGIVLL